MCRSLWSSSSVPQEWVYEGSPFTFVTDGLESALEQAKAVAGDKNVGVGAASIVQQCIKAGLLDEIHMDLVPVLLGGGVSLFDHLGIGPIDLERTRVRGHGVTHLTSASSNETWGARSVDVALCESNARAGGGSLRRSRSR